MTRLGVDYSTSRPGAAALRAAGYTFACRYLGADTNLAKVLSAAEAAGLRAGGVDVVSNWEVLEGAPLNGREQGVADARAAAAAHTRFGGPPARPIYFSFDKDPRPLTSAQWAQVEAYYAGVASVIGLARTGAYGGYALVQRLMSKGLIRWGWQTYAWSAGAWYGDAQLRQTKNGITVGGADCDRNEAMVEDFGQWGADDMAAEDFVVGGIDIRQVIAQWSQGGVTMPGTKLQVEPVKWEVAMEAWRTKTDATLATIQTALAGVGGGGGGLSDVDRQAIQELTAAINALNSRLASP